jgi:hypothetical protein
VLIQKRNAPFLFLVLQFALFLSASTFAVADEPPKATSQAELISRARKLHLSQEKQWRDLLHIRPNLFAFSRSQANGVSFFLSEDGHKNANAELEATLRDVNLPAKNFKANEHPLCRFPARRRWLVEKLEIPESYFDHADCPLYDAYLRRLKPNLVTVVFSSYFSGNPGSAFGHTLFRISRADAPDDTHNELLDHGIGFAVDAGPDVNPVLYALGGLFGGFTGSFANLPYYYKVREYVAAESRDLWSYDLDLTPTEVTFFVDHIWEVGGTTFDYYFFTQNCGLHILTTLEAAVPRLRLVERVPLWVMPADAIRAINEEPGLVKSIRFRPSFRTRAEAGFAQLSDGDKFQFLKFIQSEELIDLSNKTNLLDLGIDYFDFKHSEAERAEKPELADERHKLLSARAKLGVATSEIQVSADPLKRPDLGHPSMRMFLGGGKDTLLGKFADFGLRFALHDALDPEPGYPSESRIEFMNFQFRTYFDRRELTQPTVPQLQRFDFFHMASYSTWTSFERPISWYARIGVDSTTDFSCQDCLGYGVELGFGASVRVSSTGDTYLTALVEGGLLASDQYTTGFLQATLGPSVALRTKFSKHTTAMVKLREKTLIGEKLQGAFMTMVDVRYQFAQGLLLGVEVSQHYFSLKSENSAALKLYAFF